MTTKGKFIPILSLFLLCLVGSSFAASWTLDGNGGVYWNNSNYKISAYPATSDSPGAHVQYVNFTSNDTTPLTVNLSFVFTTPITGGKAELWENTTLQQQVPSTTRASSLYTFTNVSNISVGSFSNCQVGDSQDLSAYSFNYGVNGTPYTACFDSYTNSSNTYTLNASYNSTTYSTQNYTGPAWVDISDLFSYSVIGSYQIYTINNVPFSNPTNYQTRFTYSTPQSVSGKFDIYAYQGTPAQVAAGTVTPLLVLDPWYDNSRTYSFNYTIGNITSNPSTVYPFPVRVSLNTSNSTLWNTTTCTNPIILLNNTGSPLAYDLNSANSTFCGNATNNATFWVSVLSPMNGTNLTFYLGGNLTSGNNNSLGVFKNFTNYEKFSLNNLSETNALETWKRTSTLVYNNTCNNLGSCYYSSGVGGVGENSTKNGIGNATAFYVSTWVFLNGTQVGKIFYQGDSNTAVALGISDGTSNAVKFYTAPSTLETSAISTNVWHHVAASYNGTASTIFIDGTVAAGPTTESFTGKSASAAEAFYLNAAGENLVGYLAQIRAINTTGQPSLGLAWEQAEFGQNGSVGPIILASAHPTLQPSPAYYTTTIQGYDNDSQNNLNATAINWTLYVNGSNFTSGSLTNGSLGFPPQNLSLFNLSGFTAYSNLTLFVWENYTDGSSSAANSTNLTISKSPLGITSVNLTPATATAYPNSTLTCSAVVSDNDTYAPYQPVNGSLSWLDNGANQTGKFVMPFNLTNGTANSTSISPPAGGWTIGDNWTCELYANDSNTTAGPVNSTNTTISDWITNTSLNSTSLEFDLYNYTHYLNFTAAPSIAINSVSATMGWGYLLATCTNVSTNYNCSVNIQPSFTNTLYNTTVNWSINTTEVGGSTYNKSIISAYNITVNASGLYGCNATYPFITPSINYSFYDVSTLAALNATLSTTYAMVSSNESIKTISYPPTQNLTQCISIVPPSGNFQATAIENANYSGYAQVIISEPIQFYNSTLIQRPIGLTNISQGLYYTILVENQYQAIIQGALVSGSKFLPANTSWASMGSQLSDSTGSTVWFMIPANLYNFTITASGYNELSFNLTPTTTTTNIVVQLTQNNSPVVPSFNVWNDTTYYITPAGGYYNSTQLFNFTIKNNASTLVSWGVFIFQNNGSVVSVPYNQSSAASTGGTLTFSMPPNSTYTAYPWFQHLNASNFSIGPIQYQIQTVPTVNGTGVGLAQITNELALGTTVSGWTYYFLALCFACVVGIFANQFGATASGICALFVLVVATYIAPANMVIFQVGIVAITPFMATLLIGIGTLAALYIINYGV